MTKPLQIIVEGKKLTVDHFISFGEDHQYFAIVKNETNSDLYHNSVRGYELLEKNFEAKK